LSELSKLPKLPKLIHLDIFTSRIFYESIGAL
jgi:hypothetical protein